MSSNDVQRTLVIYIFDHVREYMTLQLNCRAVLWLYLERTVSHASFIFEIILRPLPWSQTSMTKKLQMYRNQSKYIHIYNLLVRFSYYRQSSAYTVLKQHGFLNNTVYFGTLICPFSTKSLLHLHGFLLTQLFFQSLKKQHKHKLVSQSKIRILRCLRRLFIIWVSCLVKKCLFPLDAYIVSCPT